MTGARAPESVVAVLGPRAAAVVDALAGPVDRSPGLQHARVDVDGAAVHLLSAPGGAEAAVQAALRGADAVVLALPAAGGPDAGTARLWEQCAAAATARAVVVTGFDEPHADFDEAVALAQRLLGDEVQPLQLPMHGDDDAVDGVLDLLRLRVTDSSSGTAVGRDPDPQHRELVAGLRTDLLEELLAGSDDEALLDRYLDGEPLDPVVVERALRAAVGAGRVAPVLALQGSVGVEGLRALLVDVLPRAGEVEPPAAAHPDGTPVEPLTGRADGALAAEVLAPAGDGWLVRVRSGQLRPGTVLLHSHAREARTADAGPADGVVHALALEAAAAGDTVSAPDEPLLLEPWPLPAPLHALAVDVDEVALEQLSRRDPTVRWERRGDQLLAWSLDADHAAALGLEGRSAQLSDADVALELDVLPSSSRPVLRALANHGATAVEAHEHEERDLVVVTARVAEHALPALAQSLRTASGGSARARRP